MDDKTINLQYTAERCMELSKYSYELVVGTREGKVKDYLVIDTEWLTKRFTHISGLEHVNDIKDFYISENDYATDKNYKRHSAFERIKSGKITFETIENESKIFYSEKNGYYKLDGPKNPNTNKEYTIVDRIVELNNIEDYFDNAFKGKVYEWKENNKTNIHADYVIAIRRNLTSKNENYYIFIDFDKTNDRKDQKQKGATPKKKYMRVVTAFPGNQNLVSGLRTVYTVLREDKINLLSKKCENLFTHNKYKEPAVVNAKPTTEYMTMDFVNKGIINSGDVAVLSQPRVSFGQAISSFIKRITDKIKALVERLLHKPSSDSGNPPSAPSQKQAEATSAKEEKQELRAENVQHLEQSQKPLVKTAVAPRKTFSQGLDELASRPKVKGSPRPPVPDNTDHKHHK